MFYILVGRMSQKKKTQENNIKVLFIFERCCFHILFVNKFNVVFFLF